jgi:hypothetical protein
LRAKPSAIAVRPALASVSAPTRAQPHPLVPEPSAAGLGLVPPEFDAPPSDSEPLLPLEGAPESSAPVPSPLVLPLVVPPLLPLLPLPPLSLPLLPPLSLPPPPLSLTLLPLDPPPSPAPPVAQSILGGGVCVPCGCIAGSVMRSTSHVRPLSGVRRFWAVPGPRAHVVRQRSAAAGHKRGLGMDDVVGGGRMNRPEAPARAPAVRRHGLCSWQT